MARKVRCLISRLLDDGSGKRYVELAGKSTVEKPVKPFYSTGSLFHEVDTRKIYAFDEEGAAGEEWIEQIKLKEE